MRKRICFSILTLLLFSVVALAAGKRFTLVLDAGHGGRDMGASGAYSKEKDLTLKYALAFGKIVERNCPDVKVVYTRKGDTYLELRQRAAIANRNKADLFVSVHINAVSGHRSVRGYQTYTLGRSLRNGNTRGIAENLEVAKRENSVIFLEKDYKASYQGFDPNSAESDIMFEFVQDKNRERSVELARLLQSNVCAATGRVNAGAFQDNLAVLRLTSMPGCLMELGFISTPDEEDFLNSDAATDRYARGFFSAFKAYKDKFDNNIVVPYEAPMQEQINVPTVVPAEYQPAPEPVSSRRTRQQDRRSARADDIREAGQPTQSAPVQTMEPSVNKQDIVDRPMFKVQFLVSRSLLPVSDVRFKGLEDCGIYEEGGLYKYTYGSSDNYNDIYELRKQILDRFPDAFIVAFKNGSRMDVNQAIQEFKNNR